MKSKEIQSEPQGTALWKRSGTNLIRYCSSKTYYARFRVKGKLVWKSLKTKSKDTATRRLADLVKAEGAKAEHGIVLGVNGRVSFGDALKAYQENGYRPVVARNATDEIVLKPLSISYYSQRVDALLKSWPGLKQKEIRKIAEKECVSWSKRMRLEKSPTAFNHTLGVLRNIIDYRVNAGERCSNPAKITAIRRAKEPSPKLAMKLPDAKQFEAFLKEIENSGSGWSKPCADLVRFLAYGGVRVTEAANISFADCDFERSQITVRGHPETGLKNRNAGEVRYVPMFKDMRKLLEKIKAERPEAKPTDKVMLVNECQKAMNRAAAAKDVQMERITHHDLRHYYATRCIEFGVDIPTVSRWLGHKDSGALAMKTYGHLRDEHSAKMAEKVTFSKVPQSKPAEPTSPPVNVIAMPQATGEVANKEQDICYLLKELLNELDFNNGT